MGYNGKITFCYNAATVPEQCHAVGLRLTLAP
jgi:hypothetical protein